VYGGHSNFSNARASRDAEDLNRQVLVEHFIKNDIKEHGIKHVPVAKIKTIQTTVSKEKLHDRLQALDLKRAKKDPPVVFKLLDGTLVLKDGNHRVSAAKMKGHKTIAVNLREFVPITKKKGQ
jgi:hypothetical protein